MATSLTLGIELDFSKGAVKYGDGTQSAIDNIFKAYSKDTSLPLTKRLLVLYMTTEGVILPNQKIDDHDPQILHYDQYPEGSEDPVRSRVYPIDYYVSTNSILKGLNTAAMPDTENNSQLCLQFDCVIPAGMMPNFHKRLEVLQNTFTPSTGCKCILTNVSEPPSKGDDVSVSELPRINRRNRGN